MVKVLLLVTLCHCFFYVQPPCGFLCIVRKSCALFFFCLAALWALPKTAMQFVLYTFVLCTTKPFPTTQMSYNAPNEFCAAKVFLQSHFCVGRSPLRSNAPSWILEKLFVTFQCVSQVAAFFPTKSFQLKSGIFFSQRPSFILSAPVGPPISNVTFYLNSARFLFQTPPSFLRS